MAAGVAAGGVTADVPPVRPPGDLARTTSTRWSRRCARELITQGPAVERVRGRAGRVPRRARTWSPSPTAPPRCTARRSRPGSGQGDEVLVAADDLRGVGQLRALHGRAPALRRHRPGAPGTSTPPAAAEAVGRAHPGGGGGELRRPAGRPRAARRVRDGVTVIEDGCHALGGHRGGATVGGPGGADMTAFSFHPVKAMTTGEGGAGDDRGRRAGRAPAPVPHPRDHARGHLARADRRAAGTTRCRRSGFNYRITDFQCALGLEPARAPRRLGRAPQRDRRALPRAAGRRGARSSCRPPRPRARCTATTCSRSGCAPAPRRGCAAFEALRAAGIGVQVHYIPVYRLPYYRDALGYPQDACPHAEELLRGR